MNSRQIIIFSFMQITAVVYGVLATALACKLGRLVLESDSGTAPFVFVMADYYRNYGFVLFLPIILWTGIMGYYSSPLSPREISIDTISKFGMTLAIFYAALGTFMAFCGMSPLTRVY